MISTQSSSAIDPSQRYRSLIDALCKQANIADPEPLYDKAIFSLDDVTFTLLHTPLLDSDTVIMLADFGKPPAAQRDVVLQRLMETNLYTYADKDGPSFCMSPENGHVVLMNRLSLASVTAESTLALMTNLTDMIKVWRQTFFLSEQTRADTVAGTPASE